MAVSGFNRPQKRRTSRRVLAALLIIISIFIILADKQQRASVATGRLNLDDPSAKALGIIGAPARGISALFSDMEARTNAFQENADLKTELTRLRMQNSKLIETNARLTRFEALLEADDVTDQPLGRIAARAVDEQDGPFVHSALINAGRDKEITKGYAVMTPDGYYGYVIRVGKSSARVLLANDLSSRIPVKSARSGSRAIMTGVNAKYPELRYIAEQADWQRGDTVVTSGDDGILPAGLPVGEVGDARQDVLKVDLFSAHSPVDWVYVSVFIPVPPPPDRAKSQADSER